jgi:hypothetical protein
LDLKVEIALQLHGEVEAAQALEQMALIAAVIQVALEE